MTLQYAYSQGDLLQILPRYNYSSFDGVGFLRGYVESRRAWLDALPDADDDALARPAAESGVEAFLNGVCEACAEGGDAELTSHAQRFFLLLQRFEVTKRLWDEVDANFRPMPGSPAAKPDTYVLFGLAALLLNGTHERHLSLLNAALKAHDIVTSQPVGRLRPGMARVARRSIDLELTNVLALASDFGVRVL